ncbi:hypothetical protein [Gramella sp. AN32]|uniref:site-specific DNA-methyltransferase (adenine-specific) n=1 Tax=Christiangramia antarctica TaxID=2058158 RepID=A0ABW5X8U2_9FLAO|nr:hypothetical protein [Gramella sp. AN32]MCM4156178.1 hypothetical protein [Gramella sp. AN32]
MIKFIQNTGDFFSSNYFDEDFPKKVLEKTGYAAEDQKFFQKRISGLKDKYFRYKQLLIDGKLRTKDRITETHNFHTSVLNALGYPGDHPEYDSLFHVNETVVLPVRNTLYRGEQPHLMVMEMQPLFKDGDEDPDGLFEQQYHSEEESSQNPPQKYHRSQWSNVFKVPEGLKISPMVVNEAVSKLFLMEMHQRPKFILLMAGNRYFLLEQEKWFRGSYLEFDLEELFNETVVKKDYYALFYALLAKETLAPGSEIVLMEQLEEDSHKSAYEVTKDLKEGVIHAVEALANEAVFSWKDQNLDLEEIDADTLKNECLNYVYRLLFLFYAESRSDLDILPADDAVYQHGYSLEMLRDLEQVPLNTASSQNGYFFHESLSRLFYLLSTGYREKDGQNRSFKVRHLDSPLFDESKLSILPRVQIRNVIWQDIILQLSLSRKKKGKTRGRISYANLGINQLGSVYESLLAFRGFFADSDYIEVHRKRKGNETSARVAQKDGSYLVPRSRRDDFHEDEVYIEKTGEMKVIKKGTFIYRLSGRDRQKSASYYTPEVLTQTTVKYTLKPILERVKNGEMKAGELLELKILEPAMGAAAFHNEVINQLAEAYLLYRQEEKKEKVAPDKYREELQKIKAYIALNNVYGVDLNPTAVELGKLSLWLNVIHKDMQTPFFGYRLGVGNAVVGAWLKVFRSKDFLFDTNDKRAKKRWWEKAPKHLQFGVTKIKRRDDEIYHFLLPDANMVPSAGIKLLKGEYPDEAKHVSDWKKDFCAPIRGNEFERLQKISEAIDYLLEEHYLIQSSINRETQIKEEFFGAYETDEQIKLKAKSYDEKEQLAKKRNQTNAPYYKLKLIMDYWCSLWFWDVRNATHLPSRTEWYDDIDNILNVDLEALEEAQRKKEEKEVFEELPIQGRLFGEEAHEPSLKNYKKDKTFVQASMLALLKKRPTSLFTNRRSEIVNELAEKHRYFHYQLEFIEVFKERGGFDVAVGNPPWLKVTFEEKGLMSEVFPELEIRKTSAPKVRKLQEEFLQVEDQKSAYYEENIATESAGDFMNAFQNYPLLKGQQTNLYKCVLENGFHWISENGYLGLLHPEGVYDDPKGQYLRREVYKRLKYHFQFINVFNLFAEVHHRLTYSINIYRGRIKQPDFYSINNLLIPQAIDLYFRSEEEVDLSPMIYDEQTRKYRWNLNGNKKRIIRITEKELRSIGEVFENTKDYSSIKLVTIHSSAVLKVIEKFSDWSQKLKFKNPAFSEGFHETSDITKHIISRETKFPNVIKNELIFSGPHITVSNPLFKTPQVNCSENSHYDYIDLEEENLQFLPRTNYVPDIAFLEKMENDRKFKNWLESYKIGFRKMLSLESERTLQPALLPRKSGHVNGVLSLSLNKSEDLLEFLGLSSSIIYDFLIKTIGSTNLYGSRLENLPVAINEDVFQHIAIRTLKLNCVNDLYSDFWKENLRLTSTKGGWSKEDERLENITSDRKDLVQPLRNLYSRRQALVEIDVLTAIALNLDLEDLIEIYNIQFPISKKFEKDTWYDKKGKIVFTPSSKTLKGVGLDRKEWESIKEMKAGETYEHTIEKSELYHGKKVTYYAPFDKCDRVADYKLAWAHFEKIFETDNQTKNEE